MSDDLVKRLRLMLEGDLRPSPLGRRAADRIEALEARVAAADKLVREIEVTMIAGDITKPMLMAMIAYQATKEGE